MPDMNMSASLRLTSGDERNIFISSEVIASAGKRPMKSPSLATCPPSIKIFRVLDISMRISVLPVPSISAPTSTAADFSPFFTRTEMSEVLNDLAAARSPRASSKFVFPWAFAPHIHTEAASNPISAKPTFLKFWSLANLIFTKIKTGIASNLKGIL